MAAGYPTPTFGLITALPEEFHAMRELLVNAFDYRVSSDRADYVVGWLPSLDPDRPHQVVVTVSGDTANNAAANACANLVRSFPSAACVIMVGIAAGVPSPSAPQRHVRLGDVVVADWGIVDYGHVRIVDGDVELRQPFPRPSGLLSHATKRLQSDELAGCRPWERWLDLGGRERLVGFQRPSCTTDILHDISSLDGALAHSEVPVSGHSAGYPKIHYAAIGSADVSLRDARLRDEIGERHNVRAIEMEGAGIGNSSFLEGLEWQVVRGISDYGDSKTDTVWRRYASLAAAAYVRALLEACPPIAAKGGHTLADGPIRAHELTVQAHTGASAARRPDGEKTARTAGRYRRRVGAAIGLIATVVAAGLTAWSMLPDGNDAPAAGTSTSSPTSTPSSTARPQIVSPVAGRAAGPCDSFRIAGPPPAVGETYWLVLREESWDKGYLSRRVRTDEASTEWGAGPVELGRADQAGQWFYVMLVATSGPDTDYFAGVELGDRLLTLPPRGRVLHTIKLRQVNAASCQ